jgi:hypothetical protein
MGEQDLSVGLAALAENGSRTAWLPAAADIRARGDRRRRRRYAASAALGLVVAAAFSVGIAMGQPRSADERPVVPQVPAASRPGAESPSQSQGPTVSPSATVPVGVPRSPIKAPPPEYSVPPGTTVPATMPHAPLSTGDPGEPPPTLP